MGLSGAAPREEVPLRPRDPPASCVEVVQRLIVRQAFLSRLRKSLLRTSGAPLLPCTCPRESGSSVVAIDAVLIPARRLSLFPCLRQGLGLSVPAVKGYQAALNLVFSLTGMAVAASTTVSWMFRCFERSCPPW